MLCWCPAAPGVASMDTCPRPALRSAAPVRQPHVVSFLGLWGPMTSYRPLPETTMGSFPPIQNLPFFIPSAKVWDFCAFQPSSSSLQGSLQERGSRQGAGLPVALSSLEDPHWTISTAAPVLPALLFLPSTTCDSLLCIHPSILVFLVPSLWPWLFVCRGGGKR